MKGLIMKFGKIVFTCLLAVLITVYAAAWFFDPRSAEYPSVIFSL